MASTGPATAPQPTRAPSGWGRWALGFLVFALSFRFLPPLWCGRDADDWWRGDRETQERLVRGVEEWIRQPLGTDRFKTGSSQFDGEWLFGTYQMAALGLAQFALEHPEQRDRCLAGMTLCEDRMLSDACRKFDRDSWKEDALDSLDDPKPHAAYLGYLNLVLSLHRSMDPLFKHRDLNDRITAKLARLLDASPIALIETYPFETYPVDNCAVAASIVLHDRADQSHRHAATHDRWINRLRQQYTHPGSGLLIQSIHPVTGEAIDQPRGSGTLLGAYFLGIAGEPYSRVLFEAGRRNLYAPVLGFGMSREYLPEGPQGRGDIDSGPIVFGRSISSTGFLLGCARQHGDAETYHGIHRTVHLFGAPARNNDQLQFAMGGPLGDAMMLALLTAQPLAQTPPGGVR